MKKQSNTQPVAFSSLAFPPLHFLPPSYCLLGRCIVSCGPLELGITSMRRSRSHLGPEFSLSNHIFCTKDSACRECEVKSLKLRLTKKKSMETTSVWCCLTGLSAFPATWRLGMMAFFDISTQSLPAVHLSIFLPKQTAFSNQGSLCP